MTHTNKLREQRDSRRRLFLYHHVKEQERSNLSIIQYCELHHIPIKFFYDARHYIYYEFKDKETLDKYKNALFLCESQGIDKTKFCKENNLYLDIMHRANRHFKYMEIEDKVNRGEIMLQDLKMEKEQEKEITFKKFKALKPIETPNIMKQQNDIEITIIPGIKVSLSHSVDSDKIVKIINFLKEL